MSFFCIQNVSLRGISAVVPSQVADNSQLKGYQSEELKRVIDAVGIEKRRVAPPGLCASDLCVSAAERLISELAWQKEEIGVLIFVSQTPDYLIPGSGIHISSRLGLPESCLVFDINQGCAGYVYGLSLISSFMSASGINKGLLLIGDTITSVVSPNDKSILPIFSDAGTATALELAPNAPNMYFNTSVYGRDYGAIMIPGGGARSPLTRNSFDNKQEAANIQRQEVHLAMKGLDVFAFSISKVSPQITELLSKTGIEKEKIDYFVFHQANNLILESIAQKLGLHMSKIPSTLKNYGNTSGASIPLTIASQLHKGGKLPDSQMLLSGFGVGLSVASVILNFNNVTCSGVYEIE